MATPDDRLKSLRFPDGVNNVAREDQLPLGEDGMPTAAREIQNYDIDNRGLPRPRRGYVNRVSAGRAHSLCSNRTHLFAIVDGDLRRYQPGPAALVDAGLVRAGVGDRFASAALAVDDLYWSNGQVMLRIDSDGVAHDAWVPTPPSPILTGNSTGGLHPGERLVALTWVDAQGRESGASCATVTSQGGIVVTLPIAPAGVSRVRIYCSEVDGDVAYRVIELPANTPVYPFGAFDLEAGKACETLWHVPMPPGHIVRFHNGRLYVATGNMLCEGVALRTGLMRHDQALRIGAGITLMEPIGEAEDVAGIWLADHKRTYWLAGRNLANAQKPVRRSTAAVPGTGRIVPGEKLGLDGVAGPVAAWLDTEGVLCLGLPGGTIVTWREGELALPVGERGALHYLEHDGLRQLMASFAAGPASSLAITDRMSGTIRRNGVTLTE